ncbi:MAG: PH domain-containing protein [Clostridia bacterium]|nr:PH domain-containing protein [Clostridia bacterium]
MIPFPKYNDNKAAPLFSAAFLIWRYRFYEDRIEIDRDFILSRATVISLDKIEMITSESDPIFSRMGRCNLIVTFAGNVFTLWGLPVEIADRLTAQLTDSEEAEIGSVRIPARELLKKSAMSTKLIRYLLILAVLWGAVFLMGSDWVDSRLAHTISDVVFRHLLVAGTLVLSLGLPTVLLWLWAFTGGFLMQYLKYHRYTAARRGEVLYFEYGFLIHRRIYLDARRVTLVEFKQTPLMRVFGYGELRIRAMGHNPLFLKSKLLLPIVRQETLPGIMEILFPTLPKSTRRACRRSLFYDFFSWKIFLPLLCLPLVFFFGWQWLIVVAVVGLVVVASILLEYQNAYFDFPDALQTPSLVILSKGGFYRTTAWIDRERVEMLAISGSRRKLRKGYANIRVKVFGKSGRYALIRNVEIDEFINRMT